MKRLMVAAIGLFVFSITHLNGQDIKSIYIGIQPSVTVEPFYDEGELDINVFPLILETPISHGIDLRVVPMVNYHTGGVENGISDLGVFVVTPFFFKNPDDVNVKPYGFYVGPVLGFGRNLIHDHYTTTLALEPGYMWKAKKRFTIALGARIGASYFGYDAKPDEWILHWGPKVTLGLWIG